MGSLEGVISLGSWGGPGGGHWSFRASQGITEIIIRQGVNIKSISFRDASGFISGTFGGISNDRGEEKKIEIKWPSEYLRSISGTYGDYNGLLVIRSLSFITNLTTHGPFGTTTNGGEPFSIPISDSVIVGFHGRSGHYLDALGIFVQPVDSHGSISLGPWGGPGTSINSITFKDADGHQYGKFGGKDPNDIGDQRTIEIDGPLEHLTTITGTYGNYKGFMVITSLSFITDLNTHGPFGTATGTSFSIPIHGSLVNGFHGRGGYYLDALGIYVKPRDNIEETISIGPWGGQGGDPWIYTTNRGISEIIIHTASNIKSISFRDITGLLSGTFGGKHPTDIGAQQIVRINWPSEHLISISGTYGLFANLLTITSLSFITNLATYGPFGTTSGTSFTIPINNSTVVGFHGRAGYYLDAIGIFLI